jgi:Uma2 family endonuclease
LIAAYQDLYIFTISDRQKKLEGQSLRDRTQIPIIQIRIRIYCNHSYWISELEVDMSLMLTKIITDIWMKTTWQEYMEEISDLNFSKTNPKAKCYFFNNQMMIENMPVGSAHASIHATILLAVSLFATFHQIPFFVLDNCSFRKIGSAECQPDIAYYFGELAETVSVDVGIINLDLYPRPDLVIEISSSSLSDDKGEKRLLYESLGVGEYWIVDVQNSQILAFAIANEGSYQIRISQVLVGLEISLLEQTLQQSRTTNQSQAIALLISKWQT